MNPKSLGYLKTAEKEMQIFSGGQTPQTVTKGQESRGIGGQASPSDAEGQVVLPTLGNAPSGQIIFVSPDDRIQLTVSRSARHIQMLKTFIENALKVIDEELVAEAKMAPQDDPKISSP